ncbi:MAG: hypothetical protein Q7J34_04150 [Bacteroidales bacterium]|nr:hypothetical protein [Bacteroidales bacterium]
METKQISGGKSARTGKGPLWQFCESQDGSFIAHDADYLSRLYFPLMNEAGMKSWVNPELKGDLCTAFSQYLTAPLVTEETHRNLSSRNCWISIHGQKPWSATGLSAWQKAMKWDNNHPESSYVKAQPGVFTLFRENQDLSIAATISVFVPATKDTLEILLIGIENKGEVPITADFTYAIPVFGRHADNFRDHRQVTTMFQRNFIEKSGVRIKPNIIHDEHGHRANTLNYIVCGTDENGSAPSQIWIDMMDFIGEGGSLDNPESVFKHLEAKTFIPLEADGREAVGAFRFENISFEANEKKYFIILQGISDNDQESQHWTSQYGMLSKTLYALEQTKNFWQNYTKAISFHTSDPSFDQWLQWVAYQVKARQIFGNSFLPDFGYGRGGRGWRDLWQDLLSIFLIDPESARLEIINNFKGVRIDGSNATIIGSQPGEFIADRNNVARAWCDHGTWPAFVLNFYIQQTGDLDILLTELPYWKDQFTHRSKSRDEQWDLSKGNHQLDINDKPYSGNLFEHLLLMQLSGFYNVGEHNILLLEGADWNDTYDMARERGESVGFYAFYAKNLELLADLLLALYDKGTKTMPLLFELSELTHLLPNYQKPDYRSAKDKQFCLKRFFDSVENRVCGERIDADILQLSKDLKEKSQHIFEIIRRQEWLTIDEISGFYNGHYNNKGLPVDYPTGPNPQIDLTSQVMALMQGLAKPEQVTPIMRSVKKLLKDEKSYGYRLCRPFKELDLNLGRLTGFVYGNKEHGSKWMQQNIMLAYALYLNGASKNANQLMDEIFKLCTNSAKSKIFPGIPSYFEKYDRGAYAWLTGSSAWMLVAITTQMFGVRGVMGNLCIAPTLQSYQFDETGVASITTSFSGKNIKVNYIINNQHNTENYRIKSVLINDIITKNESKNSKSWIIASKEFLTLCDQKLNSIHVQLTYINAE